MRHRLVLPALAIVLLSSPVSDAAPVLIERNAFAIWGVGETDRGGTKIVGVLAWTSESPDGSEESASFAFFRGWCTDATDEDSCFVVLDNGFISGKARPGEITIDGASRSAHLKITRRGRTSEVTWEDAAVVEPVGGETTCEDDESGVVAVIDRTAEASGTVWGKQVTAAAEPHFGHLTVGSNVCPGGALELRSVLADS
ncbi:MAG: hypothetical protein ACRDLB_05980 [Actinomycetota bacterium]